VVLLESGVKSSSVSESDLELYASGSKGLFRSVSDGDGSVVDGFGVLVVCVVMLRMEFELLSESKSESDSYASGS
jgi:hypothetical protein